MIGHTNRQTEIIPFNILEWEPSFAGTFRFKCLLTQLRTFNPSQELFRGSAEFPDQNLRKIGQEVHDGHSNRQRTRDYNRCIYRFILRYCFRKCGSVQKDTVVVSGELFFETDSCLCNLSKYKKKYQLRGKLFDL